MLQKPEGDDLRVEFTGKGCVSGSLSLKEVSLDAGCML